MRKSLWMLVLGSFFAVSAAGQGPADRAALEAFIDGLMAGYLEAYHVAGATVTVVKDGELFFAKGYGEADVEAGEDVDAETTLFRIGSVSKLFVWTAVMQLYEQEKIDLDADVNEYLTAFIIPDTFAEPITMKSLMAHAPGFEDSTINLFAKSPDKLAPLGELIERELPKRVRPPMVESSYSNHGTALAAHIVENVSGMAWDEYVEQHIFEPLGMTRTTFRQPVPKDLPGKVSKGYRWAGGEFVEEDFEYVPIAPAGSVSASATDMARFAIAHLNDGEYRGTRVLEADTARQMHSELFQHADGVNAMAYGFYEMNRNGQRIIGHGGDTLIFHSELALFLDQNLGYFVSFNSAQGGEARNAFAEAFTDHYFPVDDPTPLKPAPEVVADLDRYTGFYRFNRYSHTTLAKLAVLMQTVQISRDDDALATSVMGKARWIPVKPLLFREEDGYRTLAFRENAEGEITHAFIGDLPVMALSRADAWYERLSTHAIAAIAAFFVFGVTALGWPLTALSRWHYGVEARPSDRLPGWPRAVLWFGSALFLGFAALFTISMGDDPQQIVFGIPPMLQAALVLPMVGAVLAVIALVFAVRAWIVGQGGIRARLGYTIVTLMFFVTLAQLAYWNLLGFRF